MSNPDNAAVTSTPTGHETAARIRRLSKVLAASCLILIVTLPVVVALYWAWADPGNLATRANLATDAIRTPIQPWQRFAGGALTELSLALLLMGVWEARKCFRLFTTGRIFTSEAVRGLSRFAAWALASALVSIVAGAAISVVITLNNPVGMRHLAIGIGSDQVFTVFFAGMVWLLASVIGQGQELAEENASFV